MKEKRKKSNWFVSFSLSRASDRKGEKERDLCVQTAHVVALFYIIMIIPKKKR
jgi:hypothetical protein